MNSELQKEFRDILIDIPKGHADALIRLWIFFSKYSHRDHDDYYKKQCISWTGHFLEEEGKLNTALLIYENLLREMDANDSLYIQILGNKASLLRKLGNNADALSALNTILLTEKDDMTFSKLSALMLYVDIIESTDQSFSKDYESIVSGTATLLGIDVSTMEDDYKGIVRYLYRQNRESNIAISKILVSGMGRTEMVDELEHFRKNTQIDYYRKIAKDHLNRLE